MERTSLLLLLLVGCGGAVPYTGPVESLEQALQDRSRSQDFAIACLGHVSSEFPIEIKRVARAAQAAATAFAGTELVPELDFCATFGGLWIEIHATAQFSAGGHSDALGATWGDEVQTVELGATGVGFVHELLHVLDARRHIVRWPDEHQDWGTNGYSAAIAAAAANYTPFDADY